MDILLNTLKNEITACVEKAYGNVSTMKAAKRLNVTSELSTCYYDAEVKYIVELVWFYR